MPRQAEAAALMEGARRVARGTPLLREIDRGLAKS
jgi:hypothetical protein